MTILNFFVFLRENFTHTKKHKKRKKHKKHKEHKNGKDANKRTSNFPPLRCFLCALKCCLFCFCSLICVLCFLCAWNLLVKKLKSLKFSWWPHLHYYSPVYNVKILIPEQIAFTAVLYFGQLFVFCRFINKSVLEWFLWLMCK